MAIPNMKKPQLAVMNAVHDLPVLVARDKGFFKDEGLDIDFVTTPGMAQVTTSHVVKFDSIFDRPLDSVYNDGGIDQYRMCEWGIMKRAVEAETVGLRGRKIVALGASMSSFAIVVDKDSKAYEPEQLKDQAIAVTPNNGSHFTTLKMMEGCRNLNQRLQKGFLRLLALQPDTFPVLMREKKFPALVTLQPFRQRPATPIQWHRSLLSGSN